MSLPHSPPPSRSSSQTSASRKPATYDPTTRFTMPVSPATTPISPSGGKAKPTLTLNPSATPTTSFLPSPTTLQSAAALRSFFSPCSDSEDDSDDDDEANPTPIKSPRPRGHFQRLWASREAPTLPPSHPPPAIPQHLNIPASPTFGSTSCNTTNSSPEKPQFQFSPGPNTPAYFGRRPSRLAMFTMYPPTAPEAPPTGVYPPPSPWSDGALSYLSSPTAMTPTDPLLQGLQTLLATQLQGLNGMFAAPPPADLAIARAERDRLVVKTQKAYFRRTPVEVVEEMHVELQEAEEKLKVLERRFVKEFMGRLDGFVDGVKKGCKEFAKEEEVEVVEVETEEEEEEEEEEVFTSAREWPEEEDVEVEVEKTETPPAACNLAAVNPERRFTWTPSSFDDEDEDDEEYYVDETLPALSSDEEDASSPSSSSYGSSPVIGGHRAECEVTSCDCWNSFLPPSPTLSSTSQRFCVGKKGKGVGVGETEAGEWDMGWGENVVVVQQVGGIDMLMI